MRCWQKTNILPIEMHDALNVIYGKATKSFVIPVEKIEELREEVVQASLIETDDVLSESIQEVKIALSDNLEGTFEKYVAQL